MHHINTDQCFFFKRSTILVLWDTWSNMPNHWVLPHIAFTDVKYRAQVTLNASEHLWLFQVTNTSYFVSINLFPSRFVARLGYTYLRLKDNHMEILNKDDEIERLVAVTPQEMKQE